MGCSGTTGLRAIQRFERIDLFQYLIGVVLAAIVTVVAYILNLVADYQSVRCPDPLSNR
jgi:heme/copper-type cytochrome/quinol oxidase subunit 4